MAFLPLRFLRRKMSAYGLFPRSVLAQLTLYLLVLVLGLYVAEKYSQLHSLTPAAASGYGPWIVGLGSITGFFLVILFFRWVRHILMWRLRNRLLITYLFIGVVPISLLTLLVIFTAYLFAGQFATFLADDRVRTELHSLNAANQTVAAQIAASVRRGGSPVDEVRTLLPGQEAIATQFPKRSLIAFYRDEPVLSQQPSDTPLPAVFGRAPPPWMQSDYEGVVTADGMQLYLAVASTAKINGQSLVVVSFVPVDNSLTERLAAGLGRVDFMRSGLVGFDLRGSNANRSPVPQEAASDAVSEMENKTDAEKPGAPAYLSSGGEVPPAYASGDRLVNFTTPYPVRDWASGKDRAMLLSVETRPSVLYAQLFTTSLEFAKLIFASLLIIAIILAFFLVVAVLIGLGLTRRITASVSRLYRATQHINRGDFTHRIEVKRSDQLAALENSFNSMTESIERLLREQKEKERLESELAIAQQVQAQLFPKDDLVISTLEIHGICHPAQTVSGDYYDFLPLGNDKLGIAVGDISGKGISAALLMATVHSAVRVFEFGGAPMQRALAAAVPQVPVVAGITARNGHHHIPPAQVLTLLNRHLYQSTPAEKYATLFLSMYDGATRTLTYSNGGHLPPLVISRDGVRKLEDGGTVIGLLDNMAYEEKSVVLQPGELFLAYSDGITEPENEFGEFGEHRLLQLVRENFDLPLARLSEVVVNAVNDWIGSAVQPDDLTLVLARAR